MVGVRRCSGEEKQLVVSEQMEKAMVEIRPLSSSGYIPPKVVPGRGKQALAAAIVSILAFIFGTSVGWPSPVQPLLQSDKSPVGKLSAEDVSWLASLTFLGGIAGSFIWSRIADRFGRKFCGYSVTAPFLVGLGLITFCHNRYLLLVARFINGLGGSGALILSPTYISEVATDSVRGALGSFVILYLNAGIVFAYSLGAVVDYDTLNYICLSIPILFIFLFFWIPESPEFLWSQGKKEKAFNSLLWLRSNNIKCVEDELFIYNTKCQDGSVSYAALVSNRGRRMGMLIGLGLFTWQQFCGILAILSYTSFIFEKADSTIPPGKATIIVGLFQLFASFISSAIVDRSGRRILLLVSYMFMGLALTSIGTYFFLDSLSFDVSSFGWVPVVSLSVHVLTYAVGAGPVPYVVISETMPIDIRGLATSIIVLWGTSLAFVSVKIFPLLISSVGIAGCFWFFSVFCFAGFLFTWSLVPETKSVPLPEILRRLNGCHGIDSV
ncbi:facilitated trehalose transporter Tret1 [Halyomorpha halys]|uniref:facilitated trehalose transporter Tret1 n=1 Tax=Halyomorpha halys TaxID=286706 RepID=UPI0006D4D6AF|nr:facilitated trehalose transporter Tret1-like [Halyomorpha halys]